MYRCFFFGIKEMFIVRTAKILYCFVLFSVFVEIHCKYVEGELKTSEKWAFLARFCFLSEEGQFEYYIEFNEDDGDPNLLLYYDTKDQWPSVYKSNKNCEEREATLNVQQNQIVNLTASVDYYREASGCVFHQPLMSTTTTSPSRSTNRRSKGTFKLPSTKKGIVNYDTTTMPMTYSTSTSTDPTTVEDVSFETSTYFSTTEFFQTFPTTNYLGQGEQFTETEIPWFSTSLNTETFQEETTTTPGTFFTTEEPMTVATKAPIKKRSVPPRAKHESRSGRIVACHNARRFRSSRERWWFIAVSNCNGTKGINIRYKLLMTNGPPGDYWHEHFSADEFYILPVLMTFTIAYSFLMLGIVICSIELKSRQLLHATYKVFVLSCVLQFFGILFQSVVYLKYAVSGLQSPKLKRGGGVLMSASESVFLLLLLLLAKGYTITRGRLPLKASIKLTIFMCLYVVTYVSIFIYEAEVFDPGDVLYMYESPAGYGLIILRIFAWFMFVYSTVFTLKHYPEKSNFYYPFNIFGTVWFVAGPAFIVSANTYIDKWVRESVVYAVLLFIAFGGHLMFLILTMPSVANKNFPYHVKTSQIGVMEAGPGAERFGHHVYEPTCAVVDQTVIIPLSRRTEEIFQGMYQQRTSHDDERGALAVDEGISSGTSVDVTTENVLNWSVAKNATAFDLSNFRRLDRDSIDSGHSQTSRNTLSVDTLSRKGSMLNQLNLENHNPPDHYLKDVPIELFTVSKMVVANTNNLPKTTATNNTQTKEDDG